MRSSVLPSVLKRAHDVWVSVFDLEAHRWVLHLRRPVDAPAFAARTGLGDEAAVIAEDCALGAMVRKAASRGEQASR
jgi:hypothetical protein